MSSLHVLSSFSSHLSQKHKSYSSKDFRTSLTTQDELPQSSEAVTGLCEEHSGDFTERHTQSVVQGTSLI